MNKSEKEYITRGLWGEPIVRQFEKTDDMRESINALIEAQNETARKVWGSAEINNLWDGS